MNDQTLLDHTFRRWDMLLNAWYVYAAAAFAVLALFAALRTLRQDRPAVRLFQVGFAFFAWTHLLALLYILKSWAALAGQLKFDTAGRGTDFAARFENAGILDAPDAVWVVPFHVIGDALVLGGLWWLILPTPPRPQQPPPR